MFNLSIIIPHYNSSASLVKLVETIPDFKEIQVIIVDDNSDEKHKDEIMKIQMKYPLKNIEFYNNESKVNSAGICRNIGLSRAVGKWVMFADADDFFLEGFFDIAQEFFDSSNDVIFFKPTSIEVDTGELGDRHLPYVKIIDNYLRNPSLKSEVSLRYRFVVPWSKMIRLSLINKYHIVFDEVIVSNDVMFSTKIGYYMSSFEISEKTIYCVTRRKGSLTMTLSHGVFDTRLDVFINYYRYLKEHLSVEEFKALNLRGSGYLVKSTNFGIRKVFKIYLKLKKNSIPLVELSLFLPTKLFRKIVFFYRKHKKVKKYYKRVE